MQSPPEFKVYWGNVRRSYLIRYKDTGGRWRNKAVPVEKQKEDEARRWAEDFLGIVPPPAPVAEPPPALTFRQVADMVIARREEQGDPKLLAAARTLASRWLGDLADLPVQDCGIGQASSWTEWVVRSCRSHFTSRNVVSAMRGLVVEARGMGWVSVRENAFMDPWVRRLVAAGAPAASPPIVRLERHQLLRLLTSVEVPRKRRLRYAFASSTALRLGEIAALRGSDVRDGLVDVQRQLTSGTLKPPKKGSVRLVPLHPVLAGRLEGNVGALVHLLGSTGQGGNWSRELREDLALAGLPPRHRSGANFTFHALRRTGLTILRSAGTPLEDLRAIAGHSGRSVTERHYADADLQRLREWVVKAFDELLTGWFASSEEGTL